MCNDYDNRDDSPDHLLDAHYMHAKLWTTYFVQMSLEGSRHHSLYLIGKRAAAYGGWENCHHHCSLICFEIGMDLSWKKKEYFKQFILILFFQMIRIYIYRTNNGLLFS